MMTKRPKSLRRTKRTKKKRALRFLLLTMMLTFVAVILYGVSLFSKTQVAVDRAYEALDGRPTTINGKKIEPAKDNISILLLGVDDSEARGQEEASRTDAMLVATFNPKERDVQLLSIPRDSYVYIPEVGREDKITHAYAFGGVKAAVEAVEGTLDIPIHYYMEMNFDGFIGVVDALGGIDVEVPYERIEKDEKDANAIHLMPGEQTLDGRHALALARTRKLDSDVERGKRQQMIIQAMLDKASSIQSIGKYGAIIDEVGHNMKTNMTLNEMFGLLEYTKKGMPHVEMLTLDGTDDWSSGIYYYMLDEESVADVRYRLKKQLGLLSDSSRSQLSTNEVSNPMNDSPYEERSIYN